MKAYTDIEQSKKLAEFLPLESADGFYATDDNIIIAEPYITYLNGERNIPGYKGAVPCWSLAALLSVIKETIGYTIYGDNNVYMSCDLGDKPWKLETEVYDNEIDACYEMVLKLHEQNLL